VYRLWRDLGYAVGALLAGICADALGLPAAMWLVAGITFGSGLVVAIRMRETLKRRSSAPDPGESCCIEPEAMRQLSDVIVVDVRPSDEFDSGHVDGAINIPLEFLLTRVDELPGEARLVTVCEKGGGRSEKAAKLLRTLGRPSARSLCGGTEAWQRLAVHGA
jgi:rhodanese-related sulfurtransferase